MAYIPKNRSPLFTLQVGTMFLLVMISRHIHCDTSVSPCHQCHQDKATSIAKTLSSSAHGDLDCTDCHTEADDSGHNKKMSKVACGDCHDEEASTYVKHGRGKVGDPHVPTCSNCHGTHGILPSSEPKSKTSSLNITNTCGKCHQDPKIITKHEMWFDDAVQTYKKSVHGKATADGTRPEAAACNDCHSAGNTAHRILSPSDPDSSIAHFNIPNTCGKCHLKAQKDYWKGVHGKLTARGETDSPICTDCHGEHGILSPSDRRSPVNAARLAEATCAPCHESARLNEKFNIPTGRLKSFIDTYHGLKSKAGDVTVANCSSCHRYHDILPQKDPDSSIHPDNLKRTCSKCHENIHETVAQTRIHGAPGESRSKWAKLLRSIYIALIMGIIGSMIIYIVIDVRRFVLDHFKNITQIPRMTVGARIQHLFLLLSFTVLCLTGFALRFSDAWWVEILFGWEGGAPLRGLLHRISAGVFLATVFGHVIYLLTPAGRIFIKDIFPKLTDAKQAIQMIRFNLTHKGEHPPFGRFSFVEKAEYWSLVWGTGVMTVTGFFLMFDNLAADLLPKGLLDMILIIHYYEAWLAVLAILVWHMYSAVFRPSVYPMNPAWISGKMPLYMYEDEHSGDVETIEKAKQDSQPEQK